jgi:hypothetical protein
MKNIFLPLIQTLLILLPLTAHAVIIDLSEQQIKEAAQFTADHNKNTGIVLNNDYCVGEKGLFLERVIIRSKWHKLVLIYAVKAQKNERLSAVEKETVLKDTNLQMDIILYGHSIDFARDYKALILQDSKKIEPKKIHADHFQIEQYPQNIFSGFPSYRASLRTYFSYEEIDVSKPFKLKISGNGYKKVFEIDLRHFK